MLYGPYMKPLKSWDDIWDMSSTSTATIIALCANCQNPDYLGVYSHECCCCFAVYHFLLDLSLFFFLSSVYINIWSHIGLWCSSGGCCCCFVCIQRITIFVPICTFLLSGLFLQFYIYFYRYSEKGACYVHPTHTIGKDERSDRLILGAVNQ